MKQIIIFGFIITSLIFSRRDCLQQSKTDILGRIAPRPTTQDSTLSPSGHFFIHYDTTSENSGKPPDLTDEDGNGVSDYVDEVGKIADSAYHILTEIMKYDSEPQDSDGIYDIYIISYGPKAYGHCYHEGNGISHLRIDNDYIGYESAFSQTPLEIMQTSLVHEYFHAIQYGYQKNPGSGSGSDAYFYEMSSMWIEDVIVPESNDYLEEMWVGWLLDNPEGKFDNRWPQCTNCDGEGYELALFGHYLSSHLYNEGSSDEKQTTIMRDIWTEYRSSYINSNNYDKPLVVIDRVLQSKYQISFIKAWTDFISRNLYNGVYEEYYYYEDQALIDPIHTYLQTLKDSVNIELILDNKSVFIQSFEIGYLTSIIDIKHGGENYIGKIAFVTSDIDRNNFSLAGDAVTSQLFTDDVIHLVYATESSSNNLIIDIKQYNVPIPPSNLMATTAQDSIILNWNPSPGPGDSLYYIIYRDGDSIFQTIDTNYIDSQDIVGNIHYNYSVTCHNDIGESQPLAIVSILSWPNINNVTENQILKIYPNPIRTTYDSHILYALGSDYSNITLELINIRGQIVKTASLQSVHQGWHRASINNLILPEAASGIYIVRLRPENGLGRNQKITILP